MLPPLRRRRTRARLQTATGRRCRRAPHTRACAEFVRETGVIDRVAGIAVRRAHLLPQRRRRCRDLDPCRPQCGINRLERRIGHHAALGCQRDYARIGERAGAIEIVQCVRIKRCDRRHAGAADVRRGTDRRVERLADHASVGRRHRNRERLDCVRVEPVRHDGAHRLGAGEGLPRRAIWLQRELGKYAAAAEIVGECRVVDWYAQRPLEPRRVDHGVIAAEAASRRIGCAHTGRDCGGENDPSPRRLA